MQSWDSKSRLLAIGGPCALSSTFRKIHHIHQLVASPASHLVTHSPFAGWSPSIFQACILVGPRKSEGVSSYSHGASCPFHWHNPTALSNDASWGWAPGVLSSHPQGSQAVFWMCTVGMCAGHSVLGLQWTQQTPQVEKPGCGWDAEDGQGEGEGARKNIRTGPFFYFFISLTHAHLQGWRTNDEKTERVLMSEQLFMEDLSCAGPCLSAWHAAMIKTKILAIRKLTI